MRSEDAVGVAISSALKKCIETDGRPYYEQLVGVLEWQVLTYLTCYHLCKVERRSNDFFRTKLANFGSSLNVAPSSKSDILFKLNELISGGKNQLAVNFNTNVKPVSLAMSMGIGTSVVRQPDTPLYVEQERREFEHLEVVFRNLCRLIPGADADLVWGYFRSEVKKVLSPVPVEPKASVLLTGSAARLGSRLSAVNYLRNGMPVIRMGHGGGSFFALDEPYVRICELELCSTYITNGHRDLAPAPDSVPVGAAPEIKTVSDRTIEKIKVVAPSPPSSKGLYVPTSFSGAERYGPFRDLSDQQYAKWQKKVLQASPDLVLKLHPKGHAGPTDHQSFITTRRIENRNLTKVLHDYDYFVLDYWSTASNYLIQTKKPILYLDIGLRRLSGSALLELRKRVYYQTVSVDSPQNELNALMAKFSSNLSAKEPLDLFAIDDNARPLNSLIKGLLSECLDKTKVGGDRMMSKN